MRRLRQKVERDPNKPMHLQTVRGVGYRLVSAIPAEVADLAHIPDLADPGPGPGADPGP